MQDEVGKGEDDEEKLLTHLHTYSSFGEISFLCNTPQLLTIRVREISKVLRLDRQTFLKIIGIYFSDGQIILNNLLEVKNCLFLKMLVVGNLKFNELIMDIIITNF